MSSLHLKFTELVMGLCCVQFCSNSGDCAEKEAIGLLKLRQLPSILSILGVTELR